MLASDKKPKNHTFTTKDGHVYSFNSSAISYDEALQSFLNMEYYRENPTYAHGGNSKYLYKLTN